MANKPQATREPTREELLARIRELEARNELQARITELELTLAAPWKRIRRGTFSKPRAGSAGPFNVSEEIRPYVVHCSWCGREIPAGQSFIGVAVDASLKRRGYQGKLFCREDCWQNWEEIFWQRAALKGIGLTREAWCREQRAISRQRRLLGGRE